MGNEIYPKYITPRRWGQYYSRVPRSVLTVSHQQECECVALPAPPIDLHRPYERHCDNNKIKGHDTAPGHCQTLGRAISIGMNG